MNPRITQVAYKSPYKLLLTFTNNEKKEFDITPYLNYPVFEKLRDETVCSKVSVKYGTVVWDNETDLDPDTLYLEGKYLS